MNLYLIERTDEVGYDEYDSHVIAATSEDEAFSFVLWYAVLDSAPVCTLIGTANGDLNKGIVLSSFRAG